MWKEFYFFEMWFGLKEVQPWTNLVEISLRDSQAFLRTVPVNIPPP
jgi:hypothetical protein